MSTTTLPPLTREERAVAWLRDHAGANEFLRSVLHNFDRFGHLSDKQLEAIERNMARPTRVANPNPVDDGKRFACRGCGEQVFFDTNRNGVRYLAETAGQQYEGGMGRWKQPHRHTEEAVARWAEVTRQAQERLAEAVARGELVKGQTIEVYKGRKIPVGTVGVIFWVAPEADGYGVVKVGFTTADGVKHFTNIKNVRAKELSPSA